MREKKFTIVFPRASFSWYGVKYVKKTKQLKTLSMSHLNNQQTKDCVCSFWLEGILLCNIVLILKAWNGI